MAASTEPEFDPLNGQPPTDQHSSHLAYESISQAAFPHLAVPSPKKLVLVGLAILLISVFGRDYLFCMGPPLCVICLFTSAVSLGATILRRFNSRPLEAQRVPTNRLICAFTLISVLFSIGAWLTWRANAIWSDLDRSTVTAANLHGIAMAVEAYEQELGAPPRYLNDLVDRKLASDKQLLSAGDPNFVVQPSNSQYSSFAFFPPALSQKKNQDLILAFEHEAWSRRGMHLLSPWVRMVLFGDGFARGLDAAEFQQALVKDRSLRIKLGLPVYDWDQQHYSVNRITGNRSTGSSPAE